MIKNIVFDVGNVILEGTPKTALKYIDIDLESKKIIENIIFDNPEWVNLDLGIYDYNSYFEKIKNELPNELKLIAKQILYKSNEYRKTNKEIINLIKKLSNNYKIYILSDNNYDTIEYLKATDLKNYIDGWCFSCTYKEMKKGKKLFKIFFETNNLIPEECYFVDDKFENIQIGKEFKMSGFELNWEENLFDDLLKDMKNNNIRV